MLAFDTHPWVVQVKRIVLRNMHREIQLYFLLLVAGSEAPHPLLIIPGLVLAASLLSRVSHEAFSDG